MQSTSTLFSPCGDTNSYFLMPGSSFESGAPEWSLTGGAKVGTGNESAYLTSHIDTHSLSLPVDGQAVSPSVCVQGGNMMQLFAKNSGGTSSVLHVTTYAKNPTTGWWDCCAFS